MTLKQLKETTGLKHQDCEDIYASVGSDDHPVWPYVTAMIKTAVFSAIEIVERTTALKGMMRSQS